MASEVLLLRPSSKHEQVHFTDAEGWAAERKAWSTATGMLNAVAGTWMEPAVPSICILPGAHTTGYFQHLPHWKTTHSHLQNFMRMITVTS